MKFQMKSRKPVDLVFQVREAPLLHSYLRLQGHVRGPKPHQQCVYRSRRAALIAGGSKPFEEEPKYTMGKACICSCVIISLSVLIWQYERGEYLNQALYNEFYTYMI